MDGTASYKTFNATLLEFITELSETFPEYSEISTAKDALNALLGVNDENEMPMDKFHEAFGEHFDLVLSKNRQLFDRVQLPMVEEFHMGEAYDESDDETRDAIWQYITSLTTISVMSKSMSPDLIASIGSVAESCVAKIRDGSMTEEESRNPMSIMAQIAQNPELMKAINDANEP